MTGHVKNAPVITAAGYKSVLAWRQTKKFSNNLFFTYFSMY